MEGEKVVEREGRLLMNEVVSPYLLAGHHPVQFCSG